MKKIQVFERGQVWYVSETTARNTLSSYFNHDSKDREMMNISIYDKSSPTPTQTQSALNSTLNNVETANDNSQYDGSIQGKSRPYLIVSNNACNESSPVITVVPFTSKDKKHLPTHVYVNLYGHRQTILCEQVRSFNKKNLEANGSYFISKMPEHIMKKVDKCLAIQLGLNILDMAQNEISQTQYQVETLSKLTNSMIQSVSSQASSQAIQSNNVEADNSSQSNNVETKQPKQKSYLFQTKWTDDDKIKFIEQCNNHTLLEMSAMYDISTSTVSKYKSLFKKELANK